MELKEMKLEAIDKALKDGYQLHAFQNGRSQVVRIEKNGKLGGCGEHLLFEETLRRAEEDLQGGGRLHEKLYPPLGMPQKQKSQLDHLLLSDRTFQAWWENGQIFFQVKGKTRVEWRIAELQLNLNKGTKKTWESNGYVYEIVDVGGSTGPYSIIEVMFTKTVHGPSLWAAINTLSDK